MRTRAKQFGWSLNEYGFSKLESDESSTADKHRGKAKQVVKCKNEEDIFTIELNYEELKKVREQLPFLKDADEFALNPKSKIKSH